MFFLNLDLGGGAAARQASPLFTACLLCTLHKIAQDLSLNVCVCVCVRTFVRLMLEYLSLATGNTTKGGRQSALQFRPLPLDVSYGECTVSDIELSLKVTNNTG